MTMSGVFAIISEKENRIEDAIGAAEHMTQGLAAYGSADSGYEILGAAGKQVILDRKSTRLNSSHRHTSRMPSSAWK